MLLTANCKDEDEDDHAYVKAKTAARESHVCTQSCLARTIFPENVQWDIWSRILRLCRAVAVFNRIYVQCRV